MDGHGDRVVPAQGWNMHAAWDSFIQQSDQRYQELRQFRTDVRNLMGTMDSWSQTTDTTLADLTTQMEQLSTTVDDIYSVATRWMYHQEYYIDAAYRQSHHRYDPMDIDQPGPSTRPPTPILYRLGTPSGYTPQS
ncbi:hypothetical protein LXL04_019380 [Taraxacum kok-saghyz]